MMIGTIAGENLYVRGINAPTLTGTFSIRDALRAPHGSIETTAGGLAVGGLRFGTGPAPLDISHPAPRPHPGNGAGNLIQNPPLWAPPPLSPTHGPHPLPPH